MRYLLKAVAGWYVKRGTEGKGYDDWTPKYRLARRFRTRADAERFMANRPHLAICEVEEHDFGRE